MSQAEASAQLDFTHRANLSEWMDEPCSYEDFRSCLRDLAVSNRLTLNNRPTLRWLERLPIPETTPLHIVDVGSGGGDMLRRIEQWARRNGRAVRLTGIDLNPYAARAAREFTPAGSAIEWITGDAFSYIPDQPINIVISSLFTHHLPEAEIIRFLQWMEHTATCGWFINDLHRDAVPYYVYRALSTAMRWHRFVRHDGPVSVRRAFRAEDWERMIASADLPSNEASIYGVRPARLCVSRVKR